MVQMSPDPSSCHCNHLTTAHLMKNSGYVTVPREELTYYAQINSTANYVTDKKPTTSDRAGELILQEEYPLPERFHSKCGEKPYIWVCLQVSCTLSKCIYYILCCLACTSTPIRVYSLNSKHILRTLTANPRWL